MDESKVVCSLVVTGTKLSKNEQCWSYSLQANCGYLMYSNATRHDVRFVVGLISRFMDKPTSEHLVAVKRIHRYLKGTSGAGILYIRGKGKWLTTYYDSDYAGDLDDRKSTNGFVFMLSDGAISWSSKKQPIVTLFTTKADFIVAAYCVCQGIWLKRILEVLRQKEDKCLLILYDNNSTIKLSKNPILHDRSKHIDIIN